VDIPAESTVRLTGLAGRKYGTRLLRKAVNPANAFCCIRSPTFGAVVCLHALSKEEQIITILR